MSVPVEGPVWFVGAGNMGGAILGRWLESGLAPTQVTVIRPSGAPFGGGVRVCAAPPAGGPPPALVVLAVKPQMLDDVAPGLAAVLGPDSLLLSILAGIDGPALRRRFPTCRAIVRAMPNTPVALGRGVVALDQDLIADEALRAQVDALVRPLGLAAWVPADRFEAVTALSGCGPAFLYRFVDALARAGEAAGLESTLADRLALATVDGATALATTSEETPLQLAERVASRGGMTRAGLDVLDRPNGLAALMTETLAAAARRGRELGAAAAGERD